MAEQFEVTQQEVAFAPEQATDFVREFDRHIRERDAMNAPYEASIRAKGRQGVEDANKRVKEMGQLAKLSQSLSEKLVKIQEKANKEQYAQGLADALMEGPDMLGQQELEADENNLVEGQAIASETAEKYLSQGGSQGNAREIRNTGGWYGYGRFVGQLQMLGDNYEAALEGAKGSFTINIDGNELGYSQLQTKDEYNAWQRAFNASYLSAVPRTNGDVVEKYVLRSVRAASSSDRAKWMAEWEENRQAEEKDTRITALGQAITRGDTNIASRAFATYPGSNREIRQEIEASLIQLIDENIISPHDALQFYQNQQIKMNDGRVIPMSEAFKRQWGSFQDEVQKATTKEDNEFYAAQKSAAAELDRTLRGSDTRLTNAQVAEILQSPKYRDNPEARRVLDAYLTSEELDDVGSRAYLDDLYRSNNLTTEILSKFNNDIRREYASKAQQTETINSEYDPKGAQRIVRGQVREALVKSIGETVSTDDARYQLLEANGKEIHQEAYIQARQDGYDHAQAMEQALRVLEAEAKEYIELGDKSSLAQREQLPDIQVSQKKVADARKFISKNGLNTSVIPGSDAEYKQAIEYLRTKKGRMPGFFTALAAGQPFTAEQLVLKQAALRGDTELLEQVKSSPFTRQKAELPPDIQRVMTIDQNVRTHTQAAIRHKIQGGDIKYFLDVVASKESEGSGGYDAYNLGGSQGGHRAHGSGNSATDGYWDKPISSMTIGEIKRLHAQGRIHAVGRYQFIAGTFRETAARAGFSDDTVFGPAVQDQFALTRLIQRASWGNLQTGLGKEWIGLQYLPREQYNRMVQLGQKLYEDSKK